MNQVINYKKEWFDFCEYKPHKGQSNLHFPPNGEYSYENNPDGTRFTVAVCGRRFGKSYASAKEVEVVLTQPKKEVWVVAPSYSTSEKIFRMVYENLVVKKGYKPSRYSAKEQILEFDWDGGRSIFCGKSCEHPQGMIGSGCDLIIIDEASKVPNLKKIWEMYLRPTLSDKKGRCIFISTPDGFGTFYNLYLRGQNKTKNWYSFNSPSWENPHAFPKGESDPDLIEARNTMAETIYNQEFNADFTALQGRVYEDFNRRDNVTDIGYRHNLPTFMSIDWGYRMPAVLWFQVEKTFNPATNVSSEKIYVIDEIIHQTNISLEQLVEQIKKRKYFISRVYGDPAGYQASHQGLGQADIFYKMTGKRVFCLRDKTSRSISAGIDHVRGFIKSANGEVKLFINENCSGIIQDLEGYRYPEDKEGKQLREAPLKEGYNEHGADCLRYALINHVPIKNFKIRMSK